MLCDLFSAADPTERLEALTIHQAADGTVEIVSEFDSFPLRLTSKTLEIRYQMNSDDGATQNRYSVIIEDSSDEFGVYVPIVWLVDWETSTVSHTNLGAGQSTWTIYNRFRCVRSFQ